MNNSIIKSTSYIMIIGIVSKCLGFLKQIVIASYYGADIHTDIYFLSSGFTSNIAYLLCSTLSITLLTVYVSEKNKKTQHEVNMFLSSVIVLFEVLTLAVMIFFIIFSYPTMKILASSYNEEQIAEAVFIFRIVLFELLMRIIITINGTVLNAEKRFLPSQLNGIILSGVMMIFIFALSGKWNVYALVAGELAAYFIQAVFLRSRTIRFYKLSRFRISEQKNTLRLIKLLLPLLLSYGVIEINQVVDKIITTGLGEGVLSALSYGQIIFQAVTAVFITALTTVFYSYFTDAVEKKENDKAVSLLQENITLITIVLVPITVWTVLLSKDITCIVYGYGKFSAEAVYNTSLVQIGYCIGLCFLGIRELLVRAHYAYEDTRLPMITSVISVGVNIIGSIVLSRSLGVLGVTLSSSISVLLSTILLSRSIKQHGLCIRDVYRIKSLGRVLLSGIICSAVLLLLKATIDGLIIRFIVCVFCSAAIYIICLYIFKVNEINALTSILKNKICKRT